MGKKLYVGNLSYDVDNAALEAMFTEFGTVESANIIIDRMSNQSKGFLFARQTPRFYDDRTSGCNCHHRYVGHYFITHFVSRPRIRKEDVMRK